jgi:hypothetical protein
VIWRIIGCVACVHVLAVMAAGGSGVPRIWTDEALKDWATPIAGLHVRPGHYSEAEYYAVPEDNLQTYPVYQLDREPAGYWDRLRTQTPQPLVDASAMRTDADWIAAGERAFAELDTLEGRTADPAILASVRSPGGLDGLPTLPDGSVLGLRWVVTKKGISLSAGACINCHFQVRADRTLAVPGPAGPPPADMPAFSPGALGPLPARLATAAIRRFYGGEPPPVALWRQFTVPWAPDPRVERLRTASPAELRKTMTAATAGFGVFPRAHSSPYSPPRSPDLTLLRYYRYLDATGTHRLRGPEDVARYAAFVTGADPMEFGPHRILTAEQRRMRVRSADEVLYSIGMYLLSLEPPTNPSPQPAQLVAAGRAIFEDAGCVTCHPPPNYTSGKLTLAAGFEPPPNHPDAAAIESRSVDTDPALALRTRKGTGFYKIPSLRGVWRRPRLLHDASVGSLEEMFDPTRLESDHVVGGWQGPGGPRRAIPGHRFGMFLSMPEKKALLAFLRSL